MISELLIIIDTTIWSLANQSYPDIRTSQKAKFVQACQIVRYLFIFLSIYDIISHQSLSLQF